MTNKRLFICQGVSGSGKSSVAKMLAQSILCSETGETVSIRSTDELFMENGVYKFDQNKLGGYHGKNQFLVEKDMNDGVDVIVVDNTCCKNRDARPYILMARKHNYSITVIRVDCGLTEAKKRNASRSADKQIPEFVLERQASQMEVIKLDEKPFETGYEK
jgi:predicted kinase